MNNWKMRLPLYLMLLPGMVIVFIYQYLPIFGNIIAFQNFIPTKGFSKSEWVGWDNFIFVFQLPDFIPVLYNTVFIAVMKIVAGLVVPIFFALLLNEVVFEKLKRTIQTLVYLPHFLSWVLLGGIMIDILSPSEGMVNRVITWLGLQPVFFMGDNQWFPYVIVASDVWKDFGFGTIVYLASITSVNPSLYEAAVMDGANRLRQTWHITLPGMTPIIVLMLTLSLGQVLNAGFDQIFNMYSPPVYESGDIIDTKVYRLAFEDRQYSIATAVGLFKSSVSLILISLSYFMAYRIANYRIF